MSQCVLRTCCNAKKTHSYSDWSTTQNFWSGYSKVIGGPMAVKFSTDYNAENTKSSDIDFHSQRLRCFPDEIHGYNYNGSMPVGLVCPDKVQILCKTNLWEILNLLFFFTFIYCCCYVQCNFSLFFLCKNLCFFCLFSCELPHHCFATNTTLLLSLCHTTCWKKPTRTFLSLSTFFFVFDIGRICLP